MHAFTTAALINHSFSPPEKGVTVLDFMPNHPDRLRTSAPAKPLTPQQQAAKDDFMANVMQLSAELRERASTGKPGALLTQMGLVAPD